VPGRLLRPREPIVAAALGLAWRPETARLLETRRDLTVTEVIAESIDPTAPPPALLALRRRGVTILPHGVGLSLGGAAPPERARLAHLRSVADALDAPLVSEHVAFARSTRRGSPHFLPIAYTWSHLAIVVDNVARAQDALGRPLALENPAAPLSWPEAELTAAAFLGELCDRTGASLLLDVANLDADHRNFGTDLAATLATLPLERIAYLHVAGGATVDGHWRDTHAHPLAPSTLALLTEVLGRTGPRPVVLERDHHFDDRAALEADLVAVAAAIAAAPTPPSAPPAGPRLSPVGRLPAADRALADAAQDALLAALLDDAPAPPGFVAAELDQTRALLASKRATTAARARRHGHR